MPNKENIMPYKFKKGQSGNPKGKKKGLRNRSTIAKKVLEMTGMIPAATFENLKKLYPTLEATMSVEEMMTIIQSFKSIVKQDTSAYEKLLDSAYGKAAQGITGPDGDPIQVEVKRKMSKKELIEEAKSRGLPSQIFNQE